MNTLQKSLVILSEALPLGGTSTFVLNLCEGLREGTSWTGYGASVRGIGEIGLQMQDRGITVFSPRRESILHEDRIEDIYRNCASVSARAVVAGLGSSAFDFLRYVPPGCLRIGMIQSDDEPVYELVRSYLPWLDLVVGVSREICRKMESRLGGAKVKVICQPYGVPMPPAVPAPPVAAPMRVLYLGRVVEEQKRVGLMARVIRRTMASGADLVWTIAGDGPELAELRSTLSGLEDRVKLLGSVPYRDVPGIIRDHDVYFLCSDYEGLPLSLLEAMGAGLVPVVSDLPSGISEVVDDENGIRVDINDEEGFVNALLDLSSDPARRNAFSLRAREKVSESYSTIAMAHRWVSMLESHLDESLPRWKKNCTATAPLELAGKWQFSPTLRPVRRLLKRLRS
jgi:glycosyltransferase involved in cell wall biosynthesis